MSVESILRKVPGVGNVLANLLFQWAYFPVLAFLLLAFDTALTFLVIKKVPYTPIDWDAYMQQVETILAGERDYINIKGETGPLVYPAGHVYLYTLFHYVTGAGTSIITGQYLFMGLYLAVITTMFAVHYNAKASPPWTAILFVLSKRIHSIFVLRLFNDGICTLLSVVAVLLFVQRKNYRACLVYSLAVSVKMTALLYAPGILAVLLIQYGLIRTIPRLVVCAVVQAVVGLPFLLGNPLNYLLKAFELSRVFFFKWTVNWKFLPEDVFVSKPLALALLSAHVLALVLFATRHWSQFTGAPSKTGDPLLTPRVTMVILCTSNFVGIAFARTLHYQFYVSYFFTLPALLWNTAIPTPFKLAIMLAVEYAFNVFPATPRSSAVLQVSHALLILGLYFGQQGLPSAHESKKLKSK